MTLNLKEIIDIHSDMLRPCPVCGSQTLVVEESINRSTVFHFDNLKIEKIDDEFITHPNIHYSFRCYKCRTFIFGKTITLREEKNYFEVIARLFKDMEHAKTKARLGNTRQSVITKNGKTI